MHGGARRKWQEAVEGQTAAAAAIAVEWMGGDAAVARAARAVARAKAVGEVAVLVATVKRMASAAVSSTCKRGRDERGS